MEAGAAYLAALRHHVPAHGVPLAFFSDRHGIFRVNAEDARGGDGKTEFGRTVERLEIARINALMPQAKGRVELANQTLQDRLVKEMRLSNISSIDQAEAFLPGFMIRYNDRFAVPPGDKGRGAPSVGEDGGRSRPCAGVPGGAGAVEVADLRLRRHEVLREDARARDVDARRQGRGPPVRRRAAALLL